MSANVIREYLVGLGFGLNEPELRQFENALDRIDGMVSDRSDSMAGSFGKFLVGANTGIAAMAAGLLGLVDHVAMADQEYRLFAIHTYMNQDAAKGFKIALDSLGVSLSDIYRDPELYSRFTKLLEDQAALQKGLPGDYAQTMRDARDLRFEFTRLKVEAQYGLMGLAESVFKNLGGEDFLTRFQHFNDQVIKDLPHLVDVASREVTPILRDIMDIGRESYHIFENLATMFVQFTGELSGDEGLAHGKANFENLAKATKIWLDSLLWVVKELDHIIEIFTQHPDLMRVLGGAALGGKIGSAFGPEGAIAGAGIGAAGGAIWGMIHGAGEVGRANRDLLESQQEYQALHEKRLQLQAQKIMGGLNMPTEQKVLQAAAEAGVPKNIALSLAYQESKFDQSAISKAGAIGVMQLMPGTANDMGVDPYNEDGNIRGGMKYLRKLYDDLGDWSKAVQAYNSGERNVRRGIVPPETAAYVPQVLGRASELNDAWQRYDDGARQSLEPMSYHVSGGDTTIHVDVGGVHLNQPGASPEEVRTAVAAGVRDGLDRQHMQTNFELQGVFA
jgi:Transglycosylase SLT domain